MSENEVIRRIAGSPVALQHHLFRVTGAGYVAESGLGYEGRYKYRRTLGTTMLSALCVTSFQRRPHDVWCEVASSVYPHWFKERMIEEYERVLSVKGAFVTAATYA